MPRDSAPAPGYSWPYLAEAPPFVVCERCAAIVALDLSNPPHPRGSGIARHDEWHRRLNGAKLHLVDRPGDDSGREPTGYTPES
jgi:hypothetical protein